MDKSLSSVMDMDESFFPRCFSTEDQEEYRRPLLKNENRKKNGKVVSYQNRTPETCHPDLRAGSSARFERANRRGMETVRFLLFETQFANLPSNVVETTSSTMTTTP